MEKPVTVLLGLGQTVGEAIARRMLDDGQEVLAVDPSQSLLDELRKTAGPKVAHLHGAVHTRLGLRNALSAAMETFRRVDHVIAIPDLPDGDKVLDLDIGSFEVNLTRAVRGAVETIRIFTSAMVEHREDPGSTLERSRQVGSFTFVLSLGVHLSQPGTFTESVTQHAIFGAVKAASVELAELGIRVNAVIALRPRTEQQENWLKSRTPSGRPAMAEEIAETALFLSRPEVAIMTGQAVVLDGGRQRLSGLAIHQDD